MRGVTDVSDTLVNDQNQQLKSGNSMLLGIKRGEKYDCG
jgi:hypothetical protein